MKCLSVLYGFSFVIWTSSTSKAAGKYGGLLRQIAQLSRIGSNNRNSSTRKGLDLENPDLKHYENKFA